VQAVPRRHARRGEHADSVATLLAPLFILYARTAYHEGDAAAFDASADILII